MNKLGWKVDLRWPWDLPVLWLVPWVPKALSNRRIWSGGFSPFCLLSFYIRNGHYLDHKWRWKSANGKVPFRARNPMHNWDLVANYQLQRCRVRICWNESSSVCILVLGQRGLLGICILIGRFRLGWHLAFVRVTGPLKRLWRSNLQ